MGHRWWSGERGEEHGLERVPEARSNLGGAELNDANGFSFNSATRAGETTRPCMVSTWHALCEHSID